MGKLPMRATMLIRRKRELSDEPNWSHEEPKLMATDAIKALARVPSISAMRIEAEAGDRVLVSYEIVDYRQDFEVVDAVLQAQGMQRLQ